MLTVFQHAQGPFKGRPQRHEILQAGASIAHRVTAIFFRGQLSLEHYSDQHIEIYKSLAAGSQNREVQ